MEATLKSQMDITQTQISVRGVVVKTASAEIEGRVVFVDGKWLKIAAVKGEEWLEGDVVPDPTRFIEAVKRCKHLGADIFTFRQKLADPTPRFPFAYEWESIAVVPTLSYLEWWNNRVSSGLRQGVRKAVKLGVEVRLVEFTDEFIRGMMDIYNETPIRQGRPFWHYKKEFDAVKQDNSSYLDRSEFLGAYFGEELIGFLKIVYVDGIARLMQIIAKGAHHNKRVMNALIAKAIERCAEKGCTHLTYGNYTYPQGADSVTEFKQRNGFEEILIPKYYVPLTAKGWLAHRLRLHHGVRAWVPPSTQRWLKRVRASLYRLSYPRKSI
jgi:hypothetical protein